MVKINFIIVLIGLVIFIKKLIFLGVAIQIKSYFNPDWSQVLGCQSRFKYGFDLKPELIFSHSDLIIFNFFTIFFSLFLEMEIIDN